jgi:Winged helix DNA-binding domain
LDRHESPLPEAIETVGALQAQHWPALPVALWSRVRDFSVEELYAALERGELVSGTLLRGTLHLVSSREHLAYAAVVAAAGEGHWRGTDEESDAGVKELRTELLAHAREVSRSGEEIAEFLERWVARHPDSLDPGELERQRSHRWRPFLRWSALTRVPADGRWGAKAPAAFRAAPGYRERPAEQEALETVICRHLRAFGPAGPEDIASWIGWRIPPVRAALERLGSQLLCIEDEDGRPLHDLPDAPRPDPDTPAPSRLLAAFDSVLLAYPSGRRARILPDAHREAVYERANLRIRPSFLVDGLVAGTWGVQTRRRQATVTLRPLQRLARGVRGALVEEAERMVRDLYPAAVAHSVVVES